MKGISYKNCFFCDNIVDNAGVVGLYHSAFPRVFVKTKDEQLWFATFDEWFEASEVDWIDNPDEEIKEIVLNLLWNFSVLQEQKEDELYNENTDL